MNSSQDVFSLVTFSNIPEFYMVDSTINVNFVISPPLQPDCGDSIGLFRIGWLSVNNYVGLERVPLVQKDPVTADQNVSLNMTVTFNVKELTVEDGEFYQFCYLADNSHVRGVSSPFQFLMDDFEIVPDMSNFEQQSEDSFVHAQPEAESSTVLMKSNDFESTQITLHLRKIAELEEARLRAADEILACRQENEKILNQLQSVEELHREKTEQLQSDSERLMKELETKQQALLEFESRVRGLESQVESEQGKYSVLEVSFSALRDAQKQLEARCIKLTREKKYLEADRSQLLSKNLEMSRRVTELTSLTSPQLVTDEVVDDHQTQVNAENPTSEQRGELVESISDVIQEEDMAPKANDDISPGERIGASVLPASERADEPSAPTLDAIMDHGPRERDDIMRIPGGQTVIYPFPYPIPPTWFPNPYANYVPEAYRTVQ